MMHSIRELIFLTLFLIIGPVFSQYGIKVGPSVSNIRTQSTNVGSTYEDYMNPTYFIRVGLFKEFLLADKLALSPEVMYAREGGKTDYQVIELDYVVVPISIKYYPEENISFQIGGFSSYLISDEVMTSFTSLHSFNRLNGGVHFGLEGSIQKARIGVVHYWGLTDIELDDRFSMKTLSTNIYVAYRLDSLISSD